VAADLAVIVVNWNVRDLLEDCLASVRVATDAAELSAETWVVDNASQDGSVEMLCRQFGEVELIASPLNLGFAGGNNLALRSMGFLGVPIPSAINVLDLPRPIRDAVIRKRDGKPLPRYVLLLNPDTSVRETALREMVGFMDDHPHVGVCGPSLVYGDGQFQHAGYRFPSLAQTFLDFWPINWRLTESALNGRYPRRLYEGGQPFPIDHPLGAAMLVRREAIVQTGGFDLDYRMYVEEIDWCMRVKRAGWSIYCVPEAEIVHHEGQSTRQARPEMVVALWRSRYILFRKHYSSAFIWLARLIIHAGVRNRIRRVESALAQGALDEADARAMVDAYGRVAAL
jgi:GT2 family glycosyltransferase